MPAARQDSSESVGRHSQGIISIDSSEGEQPNGGPGASVDGSDSSSDGPRAKGRGLVGSGDSSSVRSDGSGGIDIMDVLQDRQSKISALLDRMSQPRIHDEAEPQELRAAALAAFRRSPEHFHVPQHAHGAAGIVEGLAGAIAETSAVVDFKQKQSIAAEVGGHRGQSIKGRTPLSPQDCLDLSLELLARCGRTSLGGDVYEVLRWSLGHPDHTLVCPLSQDGEPLCFQVTDTYLGPAGGELANRNDGTSTHATAGAAAAAAAATPLSIRPQETAATYPTGVFVRFSCCFTYKLVNLAAPSGFVGGVESPTGKRHSS